RHQRGTIARQLPRAHHRRTITDTTHTARITVKHSGDKTHYASPISNHQTTHTRASSMNNRETTPTRTSAPNNHGHNSHCAHHRGRAALQGRVRNPNNPGL